MKPRFPGYALCLAMMRKHDAWTQEEGFNWLQSQADRHIDALMADFRREQQRGLKYWLLELIGEARSPKALGLLCEQLRSGDGSLRDRALRGLQALDTREARRVLFDVRTEGRTGRC